MYKILFEVGNPHTERRIHQTSQHNLAQQRQEEGSKQQRLVPPAAAARVFAGFYPVVI